ncbi:MAG: hypothetical protein M1826_004057 [Phylliscum demangeonii]|nr:MAG: hypothetical protein M1826_004057 [Phylliscum demangeonii]
MGCILTAATPGVKTPDLFLRHVSLKLASKQWAPRDRVAYANLHEKLACKLRAKRESHTVGNKRARLAIFALLRLGWIYGSILRLIEVQEPIESEPIWNKVMRNGRDVTPAHIAPVPIVGQAAAVGLRLPGLGRRRVRQGSGHEQREVVVFTESLIEAYVVYRVRIRPSASCALIGRFFTMNKLRHAVLFSPDWLTSMEDQARSRITRIGQAPEMLVVRYVANNTVDVLVGTACPERSLPTGWRRRRPAGDGGDAAMDLDDDGKEFVGFGPDSPVYVSD